MNHDPNCVFCKIATGEIPAPKLFDDGVVFAIDDLHPAAPVHILIMPHEHIPTLLDLPEDRDELIGRVFRIAANLARDKGIAENGFKLMHNVNHWGGQRVYHLHFHLLGGKEFNF